MELVLGGWRDKDCSKQLVLLSEAILKSQLVLLLRAMSGSVVIQHLGVMSMSMAHVASRNDEDVHLGPHGDPQAVQNWPHFSPAAVLRKVGSGPICSSQKDLACEVTGMLEGWSSAGHLNKGELASWPTQLSPRLRYRALRWPTPKHTPFVNCWEHERAYPADPKMQYLHGKGQQ